MNWRFVQQVLLLALLYYLIMFGLDGIVFFLAHLPPQAVNLDGLLLRLGEIEHYLRWPRFLLRRLWPGETTPMSFNYILPALNCLIWGLLLATLRKVWSSVKQ